MSPRFFSVFMRVFGLLRADFSKSLHRGCPTPKRAKKAKNRFLIFIREPPSCYCSGRRFFHFLDTGREMIFDCPSGLSWNLTGEGGAGGRPAAGTEETIKEPSFSSMETDIFPFSQFKWWRSSAGRTILPNPSIVRKYCTAITSRRLDFQFPSGLFQRFIYRL